MKKVLPDIFLAVICLKIGLAQLLWAPRILTIEDAIYFEGAPAGPNIIWAQILTVLALAISVYLFLLIKNAYTRLDRVRKYLILSWIGFIFSQIFSDILHGVSINPERLTPLFIPFIALAYLQSNRNALNSMSMLLGGILFGGLLVAVIDPNWSFMADHRNEFVFSADRYIGLLSHPNQIGALAALTIIISMRKRLDVLLVAGAAVLSLTLSQSKTSIGALLISVLYATVVWNYFSVVTKQMTIQFILAVFYISWLLMLSIGLGASGDETLTLTGRTQIWAESLEIWKSQPLFGGGSSAFDVEFRQLFELTGATSAHNQFLQALAIGGLVTVGVMTFFLYYLYKALVVSGESGIYHTAGITMLVFVLIRGISEPSLTVSGIGIPYLCTFIIFLGALDFGSKKLKSKFNMGKNEFQTQTIPTHGKS
jgi:O-antigen ligase